LFPFLVAPPSSHRWPFSKQGFFLFPATPRFQPFGALLRTKVLLPVGCCGITLQSDFVFVVKWISPPFSVFGTFFLAASTPYLDVLVQAFHPFPSFIHPSNLF